VGEGPIFGIQYRSGTVTALGDATQIVKIDAQTMQLLLTDREIFDQLQNPILQTPEARTVDVLLQYFARESGRFVKETLPYTTLASRGEADALHQQNPLDQYNLGNNFHAILARYASDQPDASVSSISTQSYEARLFEQGQENKKLYVVSEGTVKICLETGEKVTLEQGEIFGESALLGTPTTGSATLSENGGVIAIDASWFQKFTQTRQPLENLPANLQERNLLPRHLLYHLAYVGYDRVRRRLATQDHTS
jgi:CRP-like cAMP-binding protein